MNHRRDSTGDRAPEIETGSAASPRKGQLGLRVVIALTVPGDIGAIFAAVSVVLNTSLAVTALLVLALVAASLFLAHEVGRGLRLRRLGAARMPPALVALLAVIWLVAGLAAALLRLTAPLNATSDLGAIGASNSAAMSMLLAVLLFVLYVGSGLAAATLGYLRSGPEAKRALTISVK